MIRITWDIEPSDIERVRNFVDRHRNPFVSRRISRNINREGIQVDKDAVLKSIAMCLLSSQQQSGPNAPIGRFLRQNPFPLTVESLSSNMETESFIRVTMQRNGLNRYINQIPKYFAYNYNILLTSNWKVLDSLKAILGPDATKEEEREVADSLNNTYKGFGPKQSRNLLQSLGLTRYEIPIDSRIVSWLNDFGFPVVLSSSALQDMGYYHFVSDGIQSLCKEAGIYPCVLDAAIFSSFDNGQWTDENLID